uniref:ABC transporter ATP-binding protein/permease n=1 Tax=Escherichia marmotae TaxID=1499973 RepID=UPI0039823757
MPEININETTPRFEDAFIDLLGGAGTSESPLGAILHTVEGSPDETVIEAKELTKKFGDFAATDHVNFAVKRGEIFGLLGPNGAGKSTTFKMMCGLLVPTSGQALVLGMDLKESSGKARQHLGYMAQKFSLYGNLTVEQNLRFFSGVYGLRGRAQTEKITRMSEAFGLKSIASHATDELPLGFKQRLALFYFTMVIYGLSLVGFGLLISSLCSTQQQAFIGVFVFMMPAILLSGYVSPVENMPVWLQNLTWINPIRHFTDITKQIYLKDASLDIVWNSLWPLLVITATTGSAAYAMFRRKVM